MDLSAFCLFGCSVRLESNEGSAVKAYCVSTDQVRSLKSALSPLVFCLLSLSVIKTGMGNFSLDLSVSPFINLYRACFLHPKAVLCDVHTFRAVGFDELCVGTMKCPSVSLIMATHCPEIQCLR